MSKRKAIFLVISTLFLSVAAFYLITFADPVVNYYGVRMRASQFHAFIEAHHPSDPNFALYCLAQPPNLHEESICFDSKAELDHFIERKYEVEQALNR